MIKIKINLPQFNGLLPKAAPGDGPRWCEINALADGSAEIRIFDKIGGSGMSAKQFATELDRLGGRDLSVRINSPGGNVFDAVAIYNRLIDHAGAVHVRIDGLAASSASLIAMAGDSIEAFQQSTLMIHNSWATTQGNAAELRKLIDVLETIDSQICEVYAERTGNSRSQISEWLRAETYMTAPQAMERRFIDTILPQRASSSAAPKSAAALRDSMMARLAALENDIDNTRRRRLEAAENDLHRARRVCGIRRAK